MDTTPLFDFTNYIAGHAHYFVGREWIFAEIDHWLASPEGPPYFIITGAPGIGKTAIAAQLTRFLKLAAFHFCIAQQPDTLDPLRFTHSLSRQLASFANFTESLQEDKSIQLDVHISDQKKHRPINGDQIGKLIEQSKTATVAFNRTVVTALKQLYTSGFEQQLVILVDALDEAMQLRGPETIVDLLANAEGLPFQVRFVLTSRFGDHLHQFDKRSIPYALLSIRDDESRHILDARSYILRIVAGADALQARLTKQAIRPEVLIEQLVMASQGNFLYLSFLLQAIIDGTKQLDTLKNLPRGLYELYYDLLHTCTIVRNTHTWSTHYRPLLGTLAVAREPLTLKQLSQFTQIHVQDVHDALQDIRQFLLHQTLSNQDKYQLSHQSIIHFLADRSVARKFWIDLKLFHWKIVGYYLDKIGLLTTRL